jgi:hypothetical protein
LEKTGKYEFFTPDPPKQKKWDKLGDWVDKKIGKNKFGEAAVEGFFRSKSGTVAAAKAFKKFAFDWKKTMQPLSEEEKKIALNWFWSGVADWQSAKKIKEKLGFLPWVTTVTIQMFRKWLIVSAALSLLGFIREVFKGIGSENEYLDPDDGAWQKIKDAATSASFFTLAPIFKSIEAFWELIIEPSVRNQGRYKEAWLEYFNLKEKDLKRKKEQLENGNDVDLGNNVESEIKKMPKNKRKGHSLNPNVPDEDINKSWTK